MACRAASNGGRKKARRDVHERGMEREWCGQTTLGVNCSVQVVPRVVR